MDTHVRADQTEVCLNLEDNPGRLSDVHQRAVYDYWQRARGGADLPPVSAIDPTRLPISSLPYIVVIERNSENGRYRSRLTGTRVSEATAVDFTGRYIDEVDGTAEARARFDWAVANRRPYWVSARLVFSPRSYKRYNLVCLPFGDPGQPVTRLLFVFAFD